MSQTLEASIARLVAIEDIKQLKARYGAFCDDNYNPDGIASCFAEDGVWDGSRSGFGRHVGRDAIHRFFAEEFGDFLLVAHLFMNPIIEVDGDTATGQWRILTPLTVKTPDGDPESRWLLGAYDETYIRQNGVWLFQNLTFWTQLYASHTEGWAEGAMIGDMHT
jgi:hypothetical protein